MTWDDRRYWDCHVYENGSYLRSTHHWAETRKQAAKFAVAKARDYGNGADGYLTVEVMKIKQKNYFNERDFEDA